MAFGIASSRNVRSKCRCSSVLQFTFRHAVSCVLHRPPSQVIHCTELYFQFDTRCLGLQMTCTSRSRQNNRPASGRGRRENSTPRSAGPGRRAEPPRRTRGGGNGPSNLDLAGRARRKTGARGAPVQARRPEATGTLSAGPGTKFIEPRTPKIRRAEKRAGPIPREGEGAKFRGQIKRPETDESRAEWGEPLGCNPLPWSLTMRNSYTR